MIKLNGNPVFQDSFPNGEFMQQLDKVMVYKRIDIEFLYESDQDLIHLMFLKKELDEVYSDKTTHLSIPYLPYSRMDRREDYIFTLKHICKFINDLHFDYVKVMELHSDVSRGLLDRCYSCDGTKTLVMKAMGQGYLKHVDMVCYPDASAHKRYEGILDIPSVTMLKKRDFKSGKLTSMEMMGELKFTPSPHVVIVDDLCSAGGTFQWAAKIMKDAGAGKVTLVVTHCEPTVRKGLRLDTNKIDLIITTDSIIKHKDVKYYPDIYIYNHKEIMI